MGYLGWPQTSVWSWAGWIFAAIPGPARREESRWAIVLSRGQSSRSLSMQAIPRTAPARTFASHLRVGDAPVSGARTRRLRSCHTACRRPRDLRDCGRGPCGAADPAGTSTCEGLQPHCRGTRLVPEGPASPESCSTSSFRASMACPCCTANVRLSVYEATCAYVGVIVLVLAATAFVCAGDDRRCAPSLLWRWFWDCSCSRPLLCPSWTARLRASTGFSP